MFGGEFQKKSLEGSMLSHLDSGNCGGDIPASALITTIQTYLFTYLPVLSAFTFCSVAVPRSVVPETKEKTNNTNRIFILSFDSLFITEVFA